MPRVVTVATPATRSEDLVTELQRVDGLLSLRVSPGMSVRPAGDVVEVEVTGRHLEALMRVLDRYGAGIDRDVSVTTSEPMSLVSASSRDLVARDPATATLEEIELLLDRESTMGLNKTLVMLLAGVVAVVGIATNALHLVVGAMVIAPGFEPLVRLALALVAARHTWWRGARDLATGYGALVAGAAVAALLLPALGVPVPAGRGGYLPSGILVGYWDQVTVAGSAVAVSAGLAGSLLVAANRSVLTAGVMIALALVPSAALAAVGLVTGEIDVAGGAAARWLHDAAIVLATALAVLGGKRIYRRRTLRV